jgi:phosphoribosylformylglycinamidine cyclo-ligase
MVVIVSPDDAAEVSNRLEQAGEMVFRVGRIDEGPRGCTVEGPDGKWTATHNA